MTETNPINTESRAYVFMQQRLGEHGMVMLEGQLDVWKELTERGELASPLRDALKAGDTRLPRGTLLHSTGMHGTFDEEALLGVASLGIMSGELVGKVEDAETHGCADFFRVPEDTDIAGYMAYAKEPVIKKTSVGGELRMQRGERLLFRGVAFVVDPQAEGIDRIMQRDGYRDSEMHDFVHPPSGRTEDDTATILGGVPKGAIAGLILGPGVLKTHENLQRTHEIFPALPMFDSEGTAV